MSEERDAYSVEQAQAAIEADKQRRSSLAMAAVQAILAQYDCRIVALPQIALDGRIVAVAQIVAR